jgi:hypothetical protein
MCQAVLAWCTWSKLYLRLWASRRHDPYDHHVGPRIFGIPAVQAPIVAVIRRGPSSWMHVSRWELEKPTYEPGSWLRATIYPQRCDVSPDGRWFVYFALKASTEWELGPAYIAISRLPWLTSLAAWGIGNTWTRGMQFLEDASVWEVDEPDVGDLRAVRRRFGLRISRATPSLSSDGEDGTRR